mgnify:CR=1 FL=1
MAVFVLLAILGLAFGFSFGIDSGFGSRFPEKTTALISSLSSCSTKIESDKDCISSVKDGLEKVSEYIQKVGHRHSKHITAMELVSYAKQSLSHRSAT